MKESNTIAGNATIKQLQRDVLLDTKGQYMKKSNTIPGNATIEQLQREVFLSTKGQYMVHEGVKFPCMHCKQQFTSRSSLGRHQRNVHLGHDLVFRGAIQT